MDSLELNRLYDFTGKTVVVTGGTGILGGELACALVGCGANVAILDRNLDPAKHILDLMEPRANQAVAIAANVVDPTSLHKAAETVREKFGKVDCLLNAAGGNKPQATTSAELGFFDLPPDALRWVFDLNLMGTILPSQVFGKMMAEKGEGVILNISSMSAFRPLTRVRGILGRESGGQQLYAVAGGACGPGVLATDSCERHCSRLLPDQAEQVSPDRRERRGT